MLHFPWKIPKLIIWFHPHPISSILWEQTFKFYLFPRTSETDQKWSAETTSTKINFLPETIFCLFNCTFWTPCPEDYDCFFFWRVLPLALMSGAVPESSIPLGEFFGGVEECLLKGGTEKPPLSIWHFGTWIELLEEWRKVIVSVQIMHTIFKIKSYSYFQKHPRTSSVTNRTWSISSKYASSAWGSSDITPSSFLEF